MREYRLNKIIAIMCLLLPSCSLVIDRNPSALLGSNALTASSSENAQGANVQTNFGSRGEVLNSAQLADNQRTSLKSLPRISSVRRNLGNFAIPGLSLSRWENTRDINAWRDTSRPLVTLSSDDSVLHDVGVSRNGAFMASVGARVSIWDLNTLSLIRSWEIRSIGRFVELTPNGKTVVTSHDDNTVKIWQQETGFKIATLKHDASITAIAISPDGARIASADVNGHLSIWDTNTGKLLFSVEDVLRVNTLNFSNDGQWLTSSGIAADDINNTIQIWDTRYFTVELSLPGHEQVVNNVKFSPDGRYVVSASKDNTIKIWKTSDGSLYRTLRGHTDDVIHTAFSDKGYWLVSASLDNKIRIWSFPDGRTIKVLNTPNMKAQSMEHVNNRNWIVVVKGASQNVEIWASSGFTYRPWSDIRDRVSQLYKDRQKVLTVPFIPKPFLPSMRSLSKNDFESQLAFVERVSAIYGRRINRQIIAYRRAVDDRNRKIANLRQRQLESRLLVSKDVRNIAIRTARYMLGETLLFPLKIRGKPTYNPDNQLMSLRVSFTRAFFREDLVMKISEGRPAQVFYDDLVAGKVIGRSVFDFVSDSRVRLSRVIINWRGHSFTAYPIRRKSGYQIIPKDLRNITFSEDQLELQKYNIPYTNFNDFIRSILREQLRNEVQQRKSGEATIAREVSKSIPRYQNVE